MQGVRGIKRREEMEKKKEKEKEAGKFHKGPSLELNYINNITGRPLHTHTHYTQRRSPTEPPEIKDSLPLHPVCLDVRGRASNVSVSTRCEGFLCIL